MSFGLMLEFIPSQRDLFQMSDCQNIHYALKLPNNNSVNSEKKRYDQMFTMV